jgi:hypothetical protein
MVATKLSETREPMKDLWLVVNSCEEANAWTGDSKSMAKDDVPKLEGLPPAPLHAVAQGLASPRE